MPIFSEKHKSRTSFRWAMLLLLCLGIILVLAVVWSYKTKNEQSGGGNFTLEEIAHGLYVPWSLAFTSPDRLLVTERSGAVRVIEDNQLLPEPLVTFSVAANGEDGLMGLAVDPNYKKNHFLYVCFTTPDGSDSVVRFVDTPDGGQQTTLLDDIPAAQHHAGCRLKFEPDNKLYITTGDGTTSEIAQNTHSLGGKILRINNDGSIPKDNPFGNAVWSYGHRNSQGIEWQPKTNNLLSTEHGPSGFDGPSGGDEVNFIQKGGNYGWPLVSHDKTQEGTIAPLVTYTPAIAPASGMFYTGNLFPEWYGNYFFGALRGQGLYRLEFAKDNPTEVILNQKLEGLNVGRIRDVIQGPDGAIYFTTSNRDGRGTIRSGDDKVYRILPNN